MARKRALKVFRTSAGFEDAYIAAPSQKAALEAWGAKRNLFAQGAAEIIRDPELARPALERPGKVLRVPRGTTAEHLAAAAKEGNSPGKGAAPSNRKAAKTPPKPSKPRPSRAALDEARRKLEEQRSALGARQAKLRDRIEALRGEQARLKVEAAQELAGLQEQVTAEEAAYRQALSDWQG